MIKVANLSEIRISSDLLILRKIEEKDRSTFCKYTSPDHFKEAVNSDNTLGIFIDEEMVGAIVSYSDCANPSLLPEKGIVTALGYSCRKDKRNQGILSKAVSLLSKELLEKYDYILLEIDKDNLASRHVAVNAGFIEYVEEKRMIFYLKRKTPHGTTSTPA